MLETSPPSVGKKKKSSVFTDVEGTMGRPRLGPIFNVQGKKKELTRTRTVSINQGGKRKKCPCPIPNREASSNALFFIWILP